MFFFIFFFFYFFYFSLNVISIIKPTLAKLPAYGPAVSINLLQATALPYIPTVFLA